jgi:IS5 family transposase
MPDCTSGYRFQDHRQRGPKSLPSGSDPRVYALHAPGVECIGKGKARAPYEFGCKVSVVTPVTKPKGGQFVLHAKALHGNPFDGHTLGPVLAELEALTGVETRRVHVDKGYRGQKFRVWRGSRIGGRAISRGGFRRLSPRCGAHAGGAVAGWAEHRSGGSRPQM